MLEWVNILLANWGWWVCWNAMYRKNGFFLATNESTLAKVHFKEKRTLPHKQHVHKPSYSLIIAISNIKINNVSLVKIAMHGKPGWACVRIKFSNYCIVNNHIGNIRTLTCHLMNEASSSWTVCFWQLQKVCRLLDYFIILIQRTWSRICVYNRFYMCIY